MTDEEEQLLKQYLNVDGQDFEDWYLERFSSDEADREYKSVLAEAKAFEAGRARAYREIDAILDSRDHPAGVRMPPMQYHPSSGGEPQKEPDCVSRVWRPSIWTTVTLGV